MHPRPGLPCLHWSLHEELFVRHSRDTGYFQTMSWFPDKYEKTESVKGYLSEELTVQSLLFSCQRSKQPGPDPQCRLVFHHGKGLLNSFHQELGQSNVRNFSSKTRCAVRFVWYHNAPCNVRRVQKVLHTFWTLELKFLTE